MVSGGCGWFQVVTDGFGWFDVLVATVSHTLIERRILEKVTFLIG